LRSGKNTSTAINAHIPKIIANATHNQPDRLLRAAIAAVRGASDRFIAAEVTAISSAGAFCLIRKKPDMILSSVATVSIVCACAPAIIIPYSWHEEKLRI